MADSFDRLKTAHADRYAIGVERGDFGRLATAQAAARQSVGKPTLGALVARRRILSWHILSDITARLSTALADRYKIERRLGKCGMATVDVNIVEEL